MPRLTIILLILGAVAYFIFNEIFKFKAGISGTRSERQKAVDELTATLLGLELQAWPLAEISLLSHRHSLKEEISTMHVDYVAVWESIYQEPLFAIAERRYRNLDNYLIAMRMNNDVFHFFPQDSEVTLYHHDTILGRINVERPLELEIASSQRTLRLDATPSQSMIPALMNAETVWNVSRYDEEYQLTRMITETADMNPEDSKLMLLLIGHAMMRQLI